MKSTFQLNDTTWSCWSLSPYYLDVMVWSVYQWELVILPWDKHGEIEEIYSDIPVNLIIIIIPFSIRVQLN